MRLTKRGSRQVLALLSLVAAVPAGAAAAIVFTDGFESGTTGCWAGVTGAPAAPDVGCAFTVGGFTEAGLSPAYAQTAWASAHRDGSNSDRAPYVSAANPGVAWAALDGAATLLAPGIGPEGNLYVTTGRGPGFSHLHAFDRLGNLLWESAPQASLADLDSAAVANQPVVDFAGDLYVSDVNQLWALRADGSVKWVADLAARGATFGFVTAGVLTRDGWVGGVSADGKLLFFDRESGELAMPVLDLPGGAGPEAPLGPPSGLWTNGLMDAAIRETVFNGFLGYELEVANAPALDPRTGRLYVVAAGATPDVGVLYGIDLAVSGATIAFTAAMGAGSGTSPAIAPDGSAVYAADGAGVMVAIDAATGARLWDAPGTGAAASPAIGPDGTIYSGGGEVLVALDPADGSVIFAESYGSFAENVLPTLTAAPPLVPSGFPVAATNGVVSVSAERVWVPLVLGYAIANGLVLPHATVLASVDPSTGELLSASAIRDTNEGLVAVGSDGALYTSHASFLSSAAYYGLNALLPDRFDVPGPPLAGLSALFPASFRSLAERGVLAARSAVVEAGTELAGDGIDAALRGALDALAQLRASVGSVEDARLLAELGDADAAAVAADLASAIAALESSRDDLVLATPDALAAAVASLTTAANALQSAAATLAP